MTACRQAHPIFAENFAQHLNYSLMKVTVVGAGAVGATTADNIARAKRISRVLIITANFAQK